LSAVVLKKRAKKKACVTQISFFVVLLVPLTNVTIQSITQDREDKSSIGIFSTGKRNMAN
jgi:hypothetical protein